MCSYLVKLAVMHGHNPQALRHRTMSVRADGPLEAARRAEDLCNVLLDRTGGSDLWAQATGFGRMDAPEMDHSAGESAAPALSVALAV